MLSRISDVRSYKGRVMIEATMRTEAAESQFPDNMSQNDRDTAVCFEACVRSIEITSRMFALLFGPTGIRTCSLELRFIN